MTVRADVLAKFDTLPLGAYGGNYAGRRWRIAKSQFSGGRSQKIEAEELGGEGYISANLYRLATGHALLKPCEMSEEKVVAFIMGVAPD